MEESWHLQWLNVSPKITCKSTLKATVLLSDELDSIFLYQSDIIILKKEAKKKKKNIARFYYSC